MKIYQAIHKYSSFVSHFEQKYNIDDNSNLNFQELLKLVIDDGYASSYILKPAIEGQSDKVFFTVWTYERLQFKWAEEHGLKTRNLSEIKQAQIEWFKPDVFYDFSAMYDGDFLKNYPINKSIIKVAWYGIITEQPINLEMYNLRLTLHKPFLKQWQALGLKSHEFQPSFDERWDKYNEEKKEIDILFYGQLISGLLSKRSKFIEELLKFSVSQNTLNIKIHLQLQSDRLVHERILGVPIPFFKKKFPSEFVKQNSLPPIYGSDLYSTIGKSKFVINAYGNHNVEYKSNMRLFESLGCGSLLISEKGNYLEGFIEHKHYIPYAAGDSKQLIKTFEKTVSNYEKYKIDMMPEIAKIKNKYSKENQWQLFENLINEI